MGTQRLKDQFLSRTFLSYLLIFAMAASILGAGGYIVLNRQLRREYDQGYISAIRQARESLDGCMAQLTDLTLQISQLSWVTGYMNSTTTSYETLDAWQVGQQIDELTRLAALASVVDGIALAYPDKNLVISSYGRERLHVFFSERLTAQGMVYKDWYGLLTTYGANRLVLPLETTLFAQQQRLMLSISTLPMYRRSFYAALVLFIDPVRLAQQISKVDLLAESDLVAMDGEGRLVLGELGEAEQAELTPLLLSAEEGQLFHLKSLPGYEQVLYARSALTGWTLAAMIPRSETLGVLRTMNLVAVAVLAAMLLIGILLALVLAKNSLRPIRKLNALVASHGGNCQWLSYGDIERSFVRIIDQEKESRARMDAFRPLAQQSLLAGLLCGATPLSEIDLELMRSSGISLAEPRAAVCLLDGQAGAAQAVRKRLAPLAAGAWLCQQGPESWALLLSLRAGGDAEDTLAEALAEPIPGFRALGISYLAELADTTVDKLYGQAAAALQAARSAPRGIAFSSQLQLAGEGAQPSEGMAEALLQALTAGDGEACSALISAFVAQMGAAPGLPADQLHYQAYLMAATFHRALRSQHIGEALSLPPEQFLQLSEPAEIQAKLQGLCGEALELIKRYRLLRQDRLLRELTDYVEAHLEDSQLCVTSLAQTLERSVSYLSRYYKAHTGENLSEFILRKRVEAASGYLSCGSSVAEAARLSGFESELTFRRAFRKFRGMNPGDFLRQIKQ